MRTAQILLTAIQKKRLSLMDARLPLTSSTPPTSLFSLLRISGLASLNRQWLRSGRLSSRQGFRLRTVKRRQSNYMSMRRALAFRQK